LFDFEILPPFVTAYPTSDWDIPGLLVMRESGVCYWLFLCWVGQRHPYFDWLWAFGWQKRQYGVWKRHFFGYYAI